MFCTVFVVVVVLFVGSHRLVAINQKVSWESNCNFEIEINIIKRIDGNCTAAYNKKKSGRKRKEKTREKKTGAGANDVKRKDFVGSETAAAALATKMMMNPPPLFYRFFFDRLLLLLRCFSTATK